MAKNSGSTRAKNSRTASESRTTKSAKNTETFSFALTQQEQEIYDRLKSDNPYVYTTGTRYEKADARKADEILYGYKEVRKALSSASIPAEKFLNKTQLSAGYRFSDDRSIVNITFGNMHASPKDVTPAIKSFLSALDSKGFKYTTTQQKTGMGLNERAEITIKIKPRKHYSE